MAVQRDSCNDPVYLILRSIESMLLRVNLLFEIYRPIVMSSNIDMYMNVENFKFTNSMCNINQYNSVFCYGITILCIVNCYSTHRQLQYNKPTITNVSKFRLFTNEDNILKELGFNDAIARLQPLSLSTHLFSGNKRGKEEGGNEKRGHHIICVQ